MKRVSRRIYAAAVMAHVRVYGPPVERDPVVDPTWHYLGEGARVRRILPGAE